MSIKVTWYSHASFLIETDKAKLLVDPFITGNPITSWCLTAMAIMSATAYRLPNEPERW
jgi:L-ascorbate metabolism protein UlaG (beta-lactamase superfamily)